MAEQEVDILGEAIAATEKEIFDSGVSDQDETVLDDTGDRSLEEMEDVTGEEDEPDDGNDDDGDEDAGDDEPDEGKKEDRDEKGRFKAKEPDEGKDDGKDKAGEKTAAKPDPKADKPAAVPPGRLREAAEARRAAEAARDTARQELETERQAHKTQLATLQGQIEQLTRQFTALQAAKPAAEEKPAPKKEVPDVLIDPEGYARYVQETIAEQSTTFQRQLAAQKVELTFSAAHRQHGAEFEAAYQAISGLDRNNPSDRVTVQRIYNAPDPGAALMKWHRDQTTLREVGDDPAAYRQKIADDAKAQLMKDPEFRKALIEELRAEAAGANGGQPRTVTRLPKSLNGASGGRSDRSFDPATTDASDKAIFDFAFQD